MNGSIGRMTLTFLVGAWSCLWAEEPIRYYNLETVKTLKGEITEIRTETRPDRQSFIVIHLKETKSGLPYSIEVSPEWFFALELMTGSRIEVSGSDISTAQQHLLMAAEITYQGERFRFRDPHGFPLWRGQKGQRGGEEKGRRRRGGKG